MEGEVRGKEVLPDPTPPTWAPSMCYLFFKRDIFFSGHELVGKNSCVEFQRSNPEKGMVNVLGEHFVKKSKIPSTLINC